MKSLLLALKSLRSRRSIYLIIISQISICFSIITYTVCSVISQFNIIIVSNEAYKGYWSLNLDVIYFDNYYSNYKSSVDIFNMIQKYMNENNLEEITEKEYYNIYSEYVELQDIEFDEKHYKGKYLYRDLYDCLNSSGYLSETISNYWTIFSCNDFKGDRCDVNVIMIDKYLYNKIKMKTKNNVNLNNYNNHTNYFYAVMYPNITVGSQNTNLPYEVGDVLVQKNVYNFSTHCYEDFYYEIVDEYISPTYIYPHIEYSGENEKYSNLETVFLSPQPMNFSGALTIIKPDDFDINQYYTNFNEQFTLIKPVENLSEIDLSKFYDLIINCGFNIINLDDAQNNTLNRITDYIIENSLILIISLITVVFSLFCSSFLSGSALKHEAAIYRLCGASKLKLISLSAIKWGLVFIISVFNGIIITIIYSIVNNLSSSYIILGSLLSSILLIPLYILIVLISCFGANSFYSSNELTEENNL